MTTPINDPEHPANPPVETRFLLTLTTKKDVRTRSAEARLRLYHSLKTIPVLTGDPRDIMTL
ncbi:hypothetical protein [Cedecea sp. NFIX57]|uniref:hypothetical protein n=1 Tax=Cedecea sp. NFIX57 TaxID=1566286 RepID=UPI000A0E6BB4|nr:hypothetical protein [Cedecea sp. NFIX57]SMG61794.1 hypothetical protein SAMN03159353_106011 [Cedecea sp. NFIX57]